MPDFRAYCETTDPATLEIRLATEESHHLVAVNRCRLRDSVVAFNGRGQEWICTCSDQTRSSAVLRVKEFRQATPVPCAITLAQALPKGATMDEIRTRMLDYASRVKAVDPSALVVGPGNSRAVIYFQF